MPERFVLDSSAVVEILLDTGRAPALDHAELAAPAHVDVEVSGVLWQLARKGQISAADAEEAITLLAAMPMRRIPPIELLADAWTRRHNLRLADAFFAAATVRHGPVVTRDAALASNCPSMHF